jgi:hypothetical protein
MLLQSLRKIRKEEAVMRRYTFLLIVLVVIIYQQGSAQVGEVNRWHLAAGLTFPASPDQFYDYWKQGFQIAGGAEFSGQTRFIQLLTAEIDYFAFDQDRFLTRIGLGHTNTPVSGAGTYVFSLAYLIRYPFIEYTSFRPTFFAGVGCANIYRSSATVDYLNYPVNQGSYNAFIATIPIGASIEVFESGDKAVEVNFTYSFGIPKNDRVNSNFSCLKIDYSFAP